MRKLVSASAETHSSNGAGADIDALETSEWLEAIDAVVAHDGPDRARSLLTRVVERAQHAGSGPIATLNTPYVNTIPADRQALMPGDLEVQMRLTRIIRWNAMAMVVRANKLSSELGGHIASYQSLSVLYEVGYNHFWHAPTPEEGAPPMARLDAERAASTRVTSSTSRGTRRRATTRAHISRAA